MPTDFDLITIGAGHNGLITSAYAAQAGHRVAVFEQREIVGGAVSTKELFPGYQIDLGGSAHILIRQTPIVEELELEQYGLNYLELDPMFVAPFPDGDVIYFYRDLERTVNHLERLYPGEGKAYREFVTDWIGFARTMRNVFLAPPSPLKIGKQFLMGESSPLRWQEELRYILRPYQDVLKEYFDEEKLRTAIAWMAAQSGPPPTEPLTGPFVLWHPLYHEGGVARPEGGSGELTQALRRHIEAHGGEIYTNAPVDAILAENERAQGVRVDESIYTSRAVCAATHARETFDHLLPSQYRPDDADGMRVGNGFGAMLRLALDEPVTYRDDPKEEARTGLQLLCRNMTQLRGAYGEYLSGQPAQDPPLIAMTFSAVDETLAPPGGEVLWLWGQYFPYELSDSTSWSEIADYVATSMIAQFEKHAPGTRETIVGRLFQHPEWLEKHLGLYRGNVMHLEMSIDQMFAGRPLFGSSQYEGPIDDLYLTGASTHPGGGIMGASGRNAARVLLR